MYTISTDKGFKLLKELPTKGALCKSDCQSDRYCVDGCSKYDEAYQQAIDSAPFIKNEEVALELFKAACKTYYKSEIYRPVIGQPYPIEVSGYDVSEPFNTCPSIPNCTCRMLSCEHVRTYVTLTPKAVENNDHTISQTFQQDKFVEKAEATESQTDLLSDFVNVMITEGNKALLEKFTITRKGEAKHTHDESKI